jgi:hypothetical protein
VVGVKEGVHCGILSIRTSALDVNGSRRISKKNIHVHGKQRAKKVINVLAKRVRLFVIVVPHSN